MVVAFLLAWPALAVLGALFMYCCTTVSDDAQDARRVEPVPQHPALATAPVRSR